MKPGERILLFVREQAPFLAVAAQFLLLALIVREFHLESLTFSRLLLATLVAFLIHHYLPAGWRWMFFALLSVAATVRVVHLPAGLFLVAIGLGMIGICHLPIPFGGRVTLLGAVGVGLTVLRAHAEWFPALEGMWPILGSMFIFRLLIYLYDLRHRAAPFSPARAVSYFFMLPNVCFPLFPVVDYKSFCTTHYNDEPLRIYDTGIKWMFRGVVQLLLYRLVYHYAGLDLTQVVDARDAAEYVVATYLLYLHVSGQFHLIVGLLHMFGFNLPETHHLYLLASSFTDFWRRINIYWKDFILKIFFYPAFFAIRAMGTVRAIALATLGAFFATWALHSWQWFWFRGRVLWSWQDVSFWSILALLVSANAVQEARSGRRRSLSKPRFEWRARLWVGVKTIGTFVAICALWTLWSCDSTDELRVLAESAMRFSVDDAAVIAAGILVVGLAGMLWGGSTREGSQGAPVVADRQSPHSFWRSAVATSVGCVGLLLLLPALTWMERPITARLGWALRQDQLNAGDLDLQRRGYYEELDVVRANYRGWGAANRAPAGWTSKDMFRERNDFLAKEMAPSAAGKLSGTPATTNRWGMRDREYGKDKPPGTYRIVLLGSSHEVGSGVKDDETFENLVEDRLNRVLPDPEVTKYEILNLSVGGYGVLRKLVRLETDGFAFAPDVVLFFITSSDRVFDLGDMSRVLQSDLEVPFDFLNHLFETARVDGHLEDLVIRHRLQPHVPAMFSSAFLRLEQECSARGIRVFVVYRPAPVDAAQLELAIHDEVVPLARAAGLEILDLSSAFDRVADRNELILTLWDDHTNALGHRLLADKLFEELSRALPRQAVSSTAR